jgi:hypothetical protein
MRPSPPPRRPLRGAVALAALFASGALGAIVACGPWGETEVWICLNPVTGKVDWNIHDDNHYVNGMADPCHCFDPCGPANTCPIVVDAGPPGPGCPVGDAGDAGP